MNSLRAGIRLGLLLPLCFLLPATGDSSPPVSVQTIPHFAEKPREIRWFVVPDDIVARLLWWDGPRPGVVRWQWQDIRGVQRGARHKIKVPALPGEHVSAPKLSPGGDRLLFHRSAGQAGGYHDCVMTDIASGRTFPWRNGLFDNTEKWSPDGKAIAFIDGTMTYLGSSPLSSPLYLKVRAAALPFSVPDSPKRSQENVAPNLERKLAIDNDMDIESLAWTAQGDLLVGTQTLERLGNGQEGLEFIPRIMIYPKAYAPGRLWQPRASTPVPSPDGRRVAFLGHGRDARGQWSRWPQSLCVADPDGRNRRVLCDISYRDAHLYFAADGRTIVIFELSSDGGQMFPTDKKVMNAVVTLDVVDAITGTRRQSASLQAVFNPWAKSPPNDDIDFRPLGLSRDGRYFYFERNEYQDTPGPAAQLLAGALYAVRITDGQLFPVVISPTYVRLAPQ